MVTRKEKREREKGKKYFFEFIKIKNHFFKDMDKQLKKVSDPRNQSYITYDCDILLFMAMMKNVCNLKSMRDMTRQFNKDGCIRNMEKALGLKSLEELPHYDTINDFLSKLPPEEIEKIRTYMIKNYWLKEVLKPFE